MKATTTIFAAAIALSACTATPEMIEAQKDRCTQIGYEPGTDAHALCAERGTMQQQQTQGAIATGTVVGATNAAIWGAIF